MTDAAYRPDDWPPERRTPGGLDRVLARLAALEASRREAARELAALRRRQDDLAEALVLLAENDEDVAGSAVRNERLRKTIEDRADEARSYAEAPEDGAERDES